MEEAKARILDHYKNPRNTAPINEVTHVGVSKNLSCGDEVEVKLYIEAEKIRNVQIIVEGCSICIASMSILSEKILNQNVSSVLSIPDKEIIENVRIELNATREKCALLAIDAVKNALA